MSVPDATLASLVTDHLPDGTRVQPMGGLVDGFMAFRGPTDIPFWDQQWSKVLDEHRNELSGVRKGYVEVMPE